MIPFPGESAPLDWANVTAGAPFSDAGDAIRFRAGSTTLTAGDAFVAGFYDHRYLEAGADAVFSAVVETLPGSAGTLHLSGGPDPAWSLGDANASAYDLGDHAVTGAQTVVVELPWVTVADYLAEAAETAVRVACSSGSVIVQQVKLRIWPTAGVGGGWSSTPYVQPPEEKNADVSSIGTNIGAAYSTQAAFRAALQATVMAAPAAATNGLAYGLMVAGSAFGTTSVTGGWEAAYITRPPSNLTGPGFEEEAWIVPPNEVRGDDDRVIFQPVGADTKAWTQGTVTAVNDPGVSFSGAPADGLFHIDATPIDAPDPAGTLFASIIDGDALTTLAGTATVTYTDVSLPEFGTQYLRVTIWHDGHFADIAETGGTQVRLANGLTTDEATFNHLRYLWTPAPYRYWNPAAPPVTPPLRQRNRDTIRARLRASRQRSIRARGYL